MYEPLFVYVINSLKYLLCLISEAYLRQHLNKIINCFWNQELFPIMF